VSLVSDTTVIAIAPPLHPVPRHWFEIKLDGTPAVMTTEKITITEGLASYR
jgi:hypothetical protein